MTVPIVHPRLLASMPAGFFPEAAVIEAQISPSVLDDYGQPVESWAPVLGLHRVASTGLAPLSALSADERQAVGYTATDRVWHVLLKGSYPEITTAHRIVIAGTAYDIDAAETDQTTSVTRLRVSQVST